MQAVKVSTKKPVEQMKVVAEFHAHRIKPERIAYRTGIDLAFVEKLLSGEHQPRRFELMVSYYRKQRRMQRLKEARRLKRGVTRLDQERVIDRDF